MSTILQANPFSIWIAQMDRFMVKQNEDMSDLKAKVDAISSLNYALTGEGGDAIKLFYRESHIPYIFFYKIVLSEFQAFNESYEAARRNFDSSDSAYVETDFLEGELHQSLVGLQNKVTSMTDEANRIIRSVADIVSLPTINDANVLEGISQGMKKIVKTSEDLQTFDTTQLGLMQVIKEDVAQLMTYAKQLAALISSGSFDITAYKNGDMEKYPWYQQLADTMSTKTDMPEEIERELEKEEVLDKVHGVVSFFGKVNEKMTMVDDMMTYAKGGISTAFTAASYFSGRWLDVNWTADKKFTLRAADSWKATSGYSNPLAKFINKMQKGPVPKNFFGKQLSQYLKSYSNPSAVLKHFIGFQKNKTASETVEALMKKTRSRAKLGTKDLIGNAVSKLGFEKAGKAIPYVGTAITVFANLGEYTKVENADKSYTDKSVRFLAGTGMDLTMTAVGAKSGAVIGGAIGGPVGIVVGGAIGAVGGAFLSSKLKDDVVDLAGKSVAKVEEKVGKVFKSVKSWFK